MDYGYLKWMNGVGGENFSSGDPELDSPPWLPELLRISPATPLTMFILPLKYTINTWKANNQCKTDCSSSPSLHQTQYLHLFSHTQMNNLENCSSKKTNNKNKNEIIFYKIINSEFIIDITNFYNNWKKKGSMMKWIC